MEKTEQGPDFDFDEVAKQSFDLVCKGATIHQKWTCAGCGTRQTMEVPNKMFTRGICEECGHETDIKARGCNYLAIMSL